jgi:hypothetical protein
MARVNPNLGGHTRFRLLSHKERRIRVRDEHLRLVALDARCHVACPLAWGVGLTCLRPLKLVVVPQFFRRKTTQLAYLTVNGRKGQRYKHVEQDRGLRADWRLRDGCTGRAWRFA